MSLKVKYSHDWDLSTIPDNELNSEQGRRRRAKGPKSPNIKIQPCANGCGTMLNATERRKRCSGCGYVHPR